MLPREHSRLKHPLRRGQGGRRPWAPGFVPVERRELPADAPPGRIHSISPLFPRRRQNTKVVLLCVIPEYSREHSRWEHHSISPVKPRHRQDPTEGFLWDTPPMLPREHTPYLARRAKQGRGSWGRRLKAPGVRTDERQCSPTVGSP